MERMEGKVRERWDRLGKCCEGNGLGEGSSSSNEGKDNMNKRTNTTRS